MRVASHASFNDSFSPRVNTDMTLITALGHSSRFYITGFAPEDGINLALSFYDDSSGTDGN